MSRATDALARGCGMMIALPLCAGLAGGCETPTSEAKRPSLRESAGAGELAPPSSAASGGASRGVDERRPAAIWDDIVIEWSDLRPRLAERSGGSVLEEMLLDRRLERLLRERGISLSQAQIAAEEAILRESLDPDPSRADSLLRSLRQVQGLSTLRWNDLLRRNAAMRALVADEVRVTDEAVAAALDAAHGAKRRGRIISVPDARSAEKVASLLAGGASFAEVAVEHSTDRSAERGGLLAPVSRLDPSYPSSFRNALWSLPIGGRSDPLLLDQSWVFILCEGEIPADPRLHSEAAREQARQAVRRAQERLLMENLARSLLRDASSATVFDDALLESWRGVRRPVGER